QRQWCPTPDRDCGSRSNALEEAMPAFKVAVALRVVPQAHYLLHPSSGQDVTTKREKATKLPSLRLRSPATGEPRPSLIPLRNGNGLLIRLNHGIPQGASTIPIQEPEVFFQTFPVCESRR